MFCRASLSTSGLRKAPQALAVILLLPSFVGCTDLKPVAQLAKDADAAKPALVSIAADFKGSCDRQNSYTDYSPNPGPADLACANGADLAKLGSNILKEQSLLLDYFDALGDLANADATGFEKAAPSLDETFSDNALTDTQLEMARDSGIIAAAITKLVTRQYREKKILEILWQADPAVQRYTHRLAEQIDPAGNASGTSYLGLLLSEDIKRKTYYERAINKDSKSQTAVLLLNTYRAANAEQDKRKDAASGYRELMLGLGKEHAALLFAAQQKGLSKAGMKQIETDLAVPARQVTDAIATLQKNAR